MTTATCDLNVDWNKCPNCARLKERIEDAEKAAKAVSANLDRAYAGYRFERDAGRAVIYTSQWRAWQDRIDNLEQALDAAHATCTAALDEWAASIHAHRRLHEERQQEATGETEEVSTMPAVKIAHSHDLTASIAECPLCGPLDRDRIDARAALADRAQNLHMLTDTYIRQLETGDLGYNELGEWVDRLLEAGDDWSSHQSAVTNAEWRYRNAITVHSDLATSHVEARETTSPEPEEQSTPTCSRVIRITAYNSRLGGCHDVDPASLPEDFIGYLANAASAARHDMGMEARQQEAAGETEEMVTIRKDDAVDELVNVYGGHIDKWLEALRERTGAQTDADDDAEAAETEEMPTFLQDDEPTIKEDKLARELFGKLWYGDVPEPALPKSFSELSPMTLAHCARAIGLYLRLLENHAPAFTDGYPTWVAHRLIDAFDDAAETREAALAAKEGEER